METQHVAMIASAESLRGILAGTRGPAGSDVSPAAATVIEGDDPVFPTPFRIATAGAAAIAASARAAAWVWETRGGLPQSIRVDARRAAAAMRSAGYLRIDNATPTGIWDPLSGFYPVRDGRFVSIHCNFPVHARAAVTVLGTPADRAAMEAASRMWDGVALENAIHDAGGCAGFVRTAAEWGRVPQAEAVGAQTLVDIERLSDDPPGRLPMADRPLGGVRVLDLTRVLAGPTCGRVLAEHGADVLKVNAPHLPHSGPIELDTGMGKLSAHLDLREASDLATLRSLVRDCDVFSQSYRPGTLAARGFSPSDLAALRPGIVCVTLTAWGPSGPWSTRRGFDSIVQCVSGMAHASGDGTTPRLLPVSAIDYVSGYLMAYGAMVALARRATEGGSWHVRVSLARVGKWIVDHGQFAHHDLAGVPKDLDARELDRFCAEIACPAGRLRYLAPVAEMTATRPFFARGAVPVGTHAPVWPPR